MNQESGVGSRTSSAIGAGEVQVGQCSSELGGLAARFLKCIREDDRAELESMWNGGNNSVAAAAAERRFRATLSRMFGICCAFDAVECATAAVDGELAGMALLVNEVDGESGMSPLHKAANANAARCVEMLLKRRARTDQKTRGRDGRRLIPVELSLSGIRDDVIWKPEDHSIEELVVQLSERDLKAVALLCEKTKEIGDVVYKAAVGGDVVSLAILLAVAAERVSELVFTDSVSREKGTIYECVIKEAVASLGGSTGTIEGESGEKRKLLLCVIELLQLFGVVGGAENKCSIRKTTPPLIRAAKAGDETVVDLILKTSIDVNVTDVDGNSALHWCLRTCKGTCPRRMKIMWVLLEHGARSNQKNKLGLTAAHIAAENGICHAIQVLVLEDPSCITTKTEMKETPLYFAVKNDHKECVELLLSCGATTSVMNLRKQRPIDLAKSQDMRFLLTRTSITPKNRSSTVPKPKAQLQGGEPTRPTLEDHIISLYEDRATNNNSNTESPTKTEICKYYGSPSGCVRGGKCFYLHVEETSRTKPACDGTSRIDSLARWNHARRIFVGGLHPSVDSELLQKIFEENFGPVDGAMIMESRKGVRPQSRGFGFVSFKDKKSVVAALQAHHVTIMGRHVEIKGAVPKWFLISDQFQQSLHHHLQQSDDQYHEEADNTKEDIRPATGSSQGNEEKLPSIAEEEAKLEQKSWVDVVCHEKPQKEQQLQPALSNGTSQSQEQSMPRWLRLFRKWFPDFLRRVSSSSSSSSSAIAEAYALSSLKADFRAELGLDLDHLSLGFSKLSDFVKSMPDLCHARYVPNANHMVLLPVRYKPLPPPSPQQPLPTPTSASHSNPPVVHNDACDEANSSAKDHLLEVSSQDKEPPDSHVEASNNVGNDGLQSRVDLASVLVGLLGFSSKPEKVRQGEEHKVLELIAREKNCHHPSTLFHREYDFYEKYKASAREGKCFRCNLRRTLWANFPCRHLLWCVDCKAKVAEAVGSFTHKCVVCDYRVDKIDLILDETHRALHAPYAWRLQNPLNTTASPNRHFPSALHSCE